MKIGDAVAHKFVDNETLGYFRAVHVKVCMEPKRLRLRQHLKTEMPHYPADCWVLEIKSSSAGSSASDTPTAHLAKATKTGLIATTKPEKHMTIQIAKLKLTRREFGAVFKNEQRTVASALLVIAENWESSSFELVAIALSRWTARPPWRATRSRMPW
jgi:glycyl-tRNA synthetase